MSLDVIQKSRREGDRTRDRQHVVYSKQLSGLEIKISFIYFVILFFFSQDDSL